MKERNIVSGIVKRIDVIARNLSFVTLDPIDKSWDELRIPFYFNLGPEYLERVVNITTERTGLFGKKFKQKIESPDNLCITELPYSLVKRINYAYREQEVSVI